MRVLLIDSFDSFVFIIDQYLRTFGADTEVVRSNIIDLSGIETRAPDAIVLGPGPGHPADTVYRPIIERFVGDIPILGVCLGHQAIGLTFGGGIGVLAMPKHGKTSLIDHDGRGCFSGLRQGLRATRYHSLHVLSDDFPSALEISAASRDDSVVMGLRHRELPLEGLQFHPESIGTEQGMRMLANFFNKYRDWSAKSRHRGAHA